MNSALSRLSMFLSKTPCFASGFFTGLVFKFHSDGTSLMRKFDNFTNDGPFFSWILVWSIADLVKWYTLELVPRLSAPVFTQTSTVSNDCIWILCHTIQLWYNFRKSQNILVIFSLLWDAALCRLFSCSSMQKQIFVHQITTFFFFKERALGRTPLFTRLSRATTFHNVCTVAEEWTYGYLCFGDFSSSSHFHLVIRLAKKVWWSVFMFLRTIFGVVAEISSVCLRTLACFLSLVTDIFSFNDD